MQLLDVFRGRKVEEVKRSVVDLIIVKDLRQRSLIMWLIWFATAAVYYGLSFGAPSIGEDVHLSFLLLAAVEIPAYILAIIFLLRFGRRLSTAVPLIIGGIFCCLMAAIPSDRTDFSPLLIALGMGGKLCVTLVFAEIYVYVAELHPTVMRLIAVGTASFFGRIGAGASRFIFQYTESFLLFLPFVVFGAFSISAGIAALFLPETRGRQLIDTMEELEEESKKNAPEEVTSFVTERPLKDI